MVVGLLTAVLFISAILLIVLVIIQPDRSHGISGSFGGGGSGSFFGVSEDGGPLAKATQIIACVFMIVAFALYLLV